MVLNHSDYQLMYDDDVKIAQKDGTKGSRVQFKEILGVGVQFNF